MNSKKSGFFIVEVLIAVTVFVSLVLIIFLSTSFIFLKVDKSRYEADASLLVEEGLEVSYNVLLTDWSLAEGTYWPAISSGKWTLLPEDDPEEGLEAMFSRTLEIFNVCRYPQGNPHAGEIMDILGNCTGIVDEDSKLIKVSVSWVEDGKTRSLEGELLAVRI